MSETARAADHRALGLTDEEFELIVRAIGRNPSTLELAMYSVMWSEHCSYKSSRVHLRRLPSEGPGVLVGPGENAGVVDVGDGIAIALRIESHNHPSAIEPYQGAATGVGGILRDIFTMGARPIALMDPLFFGPLDDDRSAWVFDGVVRGIAGYGNSVGVPVVGGQLTFDRTYRGNPLVNVFCLGILPVNRLVLGRATGAGNLVVLLGALTGRDGIGGVSVLASAGLHSTGEEGADLRPSVQIGDPFEEKRLIEACLELLDEGLVVGIQDLGGAGLSCAASETAARGGAGMEIDVAAIPLREPAMSAVEVMTSESQERMLAVVEPALVEKVFAKCARHEVLATVIGTVTQCEPDGTGRLVVRDFDGSVAADLPAASLATDAPMYHRPAAPPADVEHERPLGPATARAAASSLHNPPSELAAQLLAMLEDPAFVFEQYDHMLFLNTVLGPGEADAAVLRLAAPGVPPSRKGLALTTDCNPRWCAVDPRGGAAATVAEAVLNLACVGARPIAAVDCLNFGNPEHEVVMWQLSEAIDGIAEGCRQLGIPVVGGNVSLYNESDGEDIDPTPTVALVGLIEELAERPPAIALSAGSSLVLLGESSSDLGGSRWSAEALGDRGGPLPPLDWEAHRRLCELLIGLRAEMGLTYLHIAGVHDVSEGGLGVCLAEMCVASSTGAVVTDDFCSTPAALFSETPSRAVLATDQPGRLLSAAGSAGVAASIIGTAGGESLVLGRLLELPVADISAARSRRLREAVEAAPH